MQAIENELTPLNVTGITLKYSSEISVEQELSKNVANDVWTIAASYLAMLLYASLALGKYSLSRGRTGKLNWKVETKFFLGINCILIVIASVSISVGIMSFAHYKATLIIAEVIPFLVLAVGVDNIFIIVNTYDRVKMSLGTSRSVVERVSRAISIAGPSILLSSTCEFIAFGLGFLVTMPAVSVFSMFAAIAVLANILLQITAFVALLTIE